MKVTFRALQLLSQYGAASQGWNGCDVAYPVTQVYDSLALEDNLQVGEAMLVKCSISCFCTSIFQLPVKEADQHLAMGLFLRGFGDLPYLRSGGYQFDSWKDQLQMCQGPRAYLYSGFFHSHLLSALEQSWLPLSHEPGWFSYAFGKASHLS